MSRLRLVMIALETLWTSFSVALDQMVGQAPIMYEIGALLGTPDRIRPMYEGAIVSLKSSSLRII